MRLSAALSLALAVSVSAAVPKLGHRQIANTTVTSTAATAAPPKIHTELSESDFEHETPPPETFSIPLDTPWIEIIEVSETGWETTDEIPRYTPPPLPTRPPPSPLVGTVITEDSRPAPSPGLDDVRQPTQGGPLTPAPQVTSEVDIMAEIISQITAMPQPGELPTPSAAPTGAPIAPTVPPNKSVTIGDTTLTITPGLSTTVQSTVVVITTGSAEQTVVIVSSSGTAVTATITRTASAQSPAFDVVITKTIFSGQGRPTSTEVELGPLASGAGSSLLNNPRKEWLLGVVAGLGFLV